MKSSGLTRRRAGNTTGLGSGGGQGYFRGSGKKLLFLERKDLCQKRTVYNAVILKGPPVAKHWKPVFSRMVSGGAKALGQNTSDGEERRLGERIGLDTRVVLAVNDADLALHFLEGMQCRSEGV